MSRTPRSFSLLCLFLVLASLPAYCDTQPLLIPITAKYQSGVPVAAETDPPLVVAGAPKLSNLKDIASPGGLAIGYGRSVKVKHPSPLRGPASLAAVGLLLTPLDHSLEKVITPVGPEGHVDGVTDAVNSLGTPQVLVPALAAMYLLGNRDDKDTANMAISALASAAIVTQGMKYMTGRARPNMADAGVFVGPHAGKGHDSFPSGHTAAAFAVATVVADRHPEQKWLYYSLATAVGVARVRKSAHFPSDVLVGAAVGMYAGDKALQGSRGILSIRF